MTVYHAQYTDNFFRRLLQRRELGVFIALVIMIIIMSFASPYFLRSENIFNILRNMSTISIMAIGITMVIVTGGIDLSVGSVLGITGMFAARMIYEGVPDWLAIIMGFASGFLLGSINGLIITKLSVNPFITTLGMLSIARGFTYLLATGLKGAVASNIPLRNEFVAFIGGGKVGPVPTPVIIMFALVIIFSFMLKNTVLGRQIYAVGANQEAARLSGVNVHRVQIFVYTITGGFCALAGLISAGLLKTAATNAGTGNELDVVAAVIIGGTSLTGGEGTIWGAVIGAAIMAVLKNSFVLLHLPAYLQTVSIGVIIILAVAIDSIRKGRAGA